MRGWISWIAATAALVIVMLASASVAPADVALPPFVDHAEWVRYGGSGNPGAVELPSLRVYPTQAGRAAAVRVDNVAAGDEAWAEVLAAAPDADTPGMHDQFLCHWRYAEFARPGKVSWNLEPWRPVVDAETMFDTGCNPGGLEEGF